MANPVSQRPRLFNFDAQGVRQVGTPVEPWFVATDVLRALGIGATRVTEALETLEDDEKGYGSIVTLGGPQEMLTVNESGLYALIFRSRKPSARLFRRWVTAEVLPAIRRTGAYAAPAPTPPTLSSPPPVALALPAPATAEQHVARILAHTIAWPRVQGLIHPVEIARTATDLRLFHELITDPADYRQVSRLLRFFQGRGYFRRWLQLGQNTLVFCEPLGRNRHRRYNVTVSERKEVAL